MGYTIEDEHDIDPAAIERAQQLEARFQPLVEGTPQWRYLVETRRLPADAVRRCDSDLAALEPPIHYFGSTDYGIASVIRAADGTVLGFAAEACGPAGERVKDKKGKTLRRFYNLTTTRLSRGLFGAVVDPKVERAVLVEGHLEKPIAAAALYPSWNVYGWGSRKWLGLAVPPEVEVLVIEDQELAE